MTRFGPEGGQDQTGFKYWHWLGACIYKNKFAGFFVAVLRTSHAGLKSTVMALPCTDYTKEVLDSLQSA